jgi:ferredoxin
LKEPDIDLAGCVACQGCEALAPEVFRLNPAGYMEVVEHDRYPKPLIEEAIAKCPKDCLGWRLVDGPP